MSRLFRGGNGVGANADVEQAAASQDAANFGNLRTYGQKTDAATDGFDTPIRVVATESIFNPFNVFRYSKFGKATAGQDGRAANPGNIDLDPYKLKYQKTTRVIGDDARTSASELRKKIANHNPSATALCTWANEQAKDSQNASGPIYPYPYSLTDFLWCKYYGKIPNNRLITLRRYPVPVEDNLMIAKQNLPLVPLAQAVTWFGEDTGNKLSDVLGLSWGLKWKSISATVQDVDGNEIKAESLLDVAGVKVENEALRKALIVALGNAQNPGMAASGQDKAQQDYDREAYGDKGPYWNRVYGPVNVIDKTYMRERGLDFGDEKGLSLTFEYNLRTWAGANPKMAFLDLLTNFLSLTYNTAPFWGGAVRYFQQTGFLAPGFNTDAFERGDNVQGIKDLAAGVGPQLLGAASDLKKFVDDLQSQITQGASVDSIIGSITDSKVSQVLAGGRLAPLVQKPLLMRSMLDGRAVGEWHMMIGNPMDPIATIGNLVLDSVSMDVGEELGEDGFPTSMKFVVNLKHGRSRAKQDIESMFNLGGGPLSYSPLAQPSSAFNTLGENNSMNSNSYYGTAVYQASGGAVPPAGANGTGDQQTSTTTNANNVSVANPTTLQKPGEAETNTANYFRPAVARAYGENFGNSPILPSYFFNRMTRD
jgi:hypothetical protein